ncbi:sigma-70 family RNA polymerase sigma factor [Streptomyces sp. NBC_01511]|uniref:sigma-70 family RNA polymerase sigma factor n=1 Tax=unclassified Streptomyces TaxID=2593676 RepID=UPI003866428D
MAAWRRVRQAGSDARSSPRSEDASIRAVLALGGVPWTELDDGVQQVRLRLLEAEADPAREEIRNPAAWQSVVASRVAADWHRSRSRDEGLRKRLAARWARDDSVRHPQADRALALSVADALERLDAAHRQVLTLRFYTDLTVRQIARQLDIPEGTVKSRLHTATSALKSTLRDMEVI